MWTKELFGTDVYHLIAAFVVYSIIGWFLESVYMSFCNRKLTNRGFGKGPFCPIYGFGAVICYLIMGPMKGHYIKIYLLGAFLATIFEFLVGKAMIRFLGELWWDYNNKPFNYQGIICLESTVAWGFYALGVVHFSQWFAWSLWMCEAPGCALTCFTLVVSRLTMFPESVDVAGGVAYPSRLVCARAVSCKRRGAPGAFQVCLLGACF